MGTVWDFSFQHWPWGRAGAAAGDENSRWMQYVDQVEKMQYVDQVEKM